MLFLSKRLATLFIGRKPLQCGGAATLALYLTAPSTPFSSPFSYFNTPALPAVHLRDKGILKEAKTRSRLDSGRPSQENGLTEDIKQEGRETPDQFKNKRAI
jgi:hypothetical protein